MLKILIIAAWLLLAADTFLVVGAIISRNMGDDAAGRGVALTLGLVALVFLLFGGAVLYVGGRAHSWLAVIGSLVMLAIPHLLFFGTDVEQWFHDVGSRISGRKLDRMMVRYPEPAQRELAQAIAIGDFPAMRKILATRPNLHGRNEAGYDLLSQAVSLTTTFGPYRDGEQRVEGVRLLLDAGMDPNQSRDPDGKNLFFMVSYRLTDPAGAQVFRLLLDHGANPNDFGFDPQPVIFSAWQDLDNLRTLLDHGANIEIRDNNDNTPLLFFVCNGRWDASKLLLDRGADIHVHNREGTTLAMGLDGRKAMAERLQETLAEGYNTVRAAIAHRLAAEAR
jgi:Ankyrin repeats (3 copies)